MDSLEHLAQLVSSILISLTLTFNPPPHLNTVEKQAAWIEKGNVNLQQKGNLLFYNQTLFTGKVILKINSDTLSVESFIDGKEDGLSIVWDDQGNKVEERLYKNGKRVGVHRGWHPNGQLKFKYSYKDDFMDGLAEEWFVDGTKYREMNYVKGHESGMQKMWSEDGSLRANYEARHGRNYGLTGIKSCKNIWQDVEI